MAQRKIKILFTIPNFDTAGSGKVVYDLVNNLDRSIFSPEICCFHNRGAFFKEIEQLNVPIHIVPFAISYRPFFTFPFRLIKVIRFFKKNKFDIIHSWHWSSDFSEPLAAKLAGIPWLMTKKSMGWGNKAWRWRSSLSTAIITINSDMNSFYEGPMMAKVYPIPLGVDCDYYSPQFEYKDSIKESLSIKESDFVLVSVVNLIPVKGIEILINAVKELNDPSIKLLIVGNDKGTYAESLKELAADVKAISFLGKKLEIRPFHKLANVFIIPTLDLGEGLPVAPLEAMASGKIVIGSNVSGVKDILEPFPDCIFKPNNVASLKEAILRIKNLSQDERGLKETNMRLRVEEVYSVTSFINSHTTLYKNLVSK